MSPKSLQIKQSEMRHVWDSFEWLIREDLERIDYRARAMMSEMQTVGIPVAMMQAFIAEQFGELWESVAEQGYEKYDKGRTRRKDVSA